MDERATRWRDIVNEKVHPRRRVLLNRFLWRTYLFTSGSLVIGAELVQPNRGHAGRIFNRASKIVHPLLGVQVDVLGLERIDPNRAYVFAPNHRSHLDISALVASLPSGLRFAAKRELFEEPVFGRALRAAGMIPIDRSDPALAKRTLEKATAKLGKAVSVAIFPEGTRAPAGQMLPFKSGAFAVAIQQQVPVVPVALHNTAQLMPAGGYLTISGGRLVVEVLSPISTSGLTLEDVPDLKERVRTALVNALRPEDGGVAQREDLAFAPAVAAREQSRRQPANERAVAAGTHAERGHERSKRAGELAQSPLALR